MLSGACAGHLEVNNGEQGNSDSGSDVFAQGLDEPEVAVPGGDRSPDGGAPLGDTHTAGGAASGVSESGGAGALESESCSSNTSSAIERQSPRLNDWQLRSTLRALFPFELQLDSFIESTVVSPGLFSTYPGANEVLSNHARDLVTIAETVALQAVEHLDELISCDPTGGSELTCVEELVRDFGARAFRKPLGEAEVDHFVELFSEVRAGPDPLDFDLAIGAVIQAILLSPETIYLLERGEPSDGGGLLRLTDYELASRLAYLLWNEPPDVELFETARTGRLRDPEVLQREAERLLDDPRAAEAMSRFVEEWFGVADRLFVDHAPEPLAVAFREEVGAFVRHMITSNGRVADLLNSDETLANGVLAEHYGLAYSAQASSEEWQRIAVPNERRGGILTMAQFAASTSHNNETSVIHRGKVVREQLLCDLLGTPDPAFLNVDFMLPEDATVRERIDARLRQPTCGACHRLMDPIGIGMEDIDENGLFRVEYGNGHPIDAAGTVLGGGSETDFHGVLELAHYLSGSEEFGRCGTTQWLRYALGRRDFAGGTTCLVDEIVESTQHRGESMRALFLGVVLSDAFVQRRAEVEE